MHSICVNRLQLQLAVCDNGEDMDNEQPLLDKNGRCIRTHGKVRFASTVMVPDGRVGYAKTNDGYTVTVGLRDKNTGKWDKLVGVQANELSVLNEQSITLKTKLLVGRGRKRKALLSGLDLLSRGGLMLTESLRDEVDNIVANGKDKNGKFKAHSVTSACYRVWSRDGVLDGTDKLPLSPKLREGLLNSVLSGMASHCALLDGDAQEETAFPTTPFPLNASGQEDEFTVALDRLATVADDHQDYEDAKAAVEKRAKGKYMPAKWMRGRDFDILWNPKRNTFYARLPLLDKGHPLAKKVKVRDLCRFGSKKRIKQTYQDGTELVPLLIKPDEPFFRKFIDASHQGIAWPVATTLTFDGEDFWLSTAFQYVCEPYIPETILGVDMNIWDFVSFALTDMDGNALMKETWGIHDFLNWRREHKAQTAEAQREGQVVSGHRDANRSDSICHQFSHAIAELALHHKALVVFEKLDNINSRKRSPGGFKTIPVAKFQGFVKYKMRLGGGDARQVWAAYTSKTCTDCGSMNTERDNGVLECKDCGYTGNVHEVGALNVARRELSWRKLGTGDLKYFYRWLHAEDCDAERKLIKDEVESQKKSKKKSKKK